jgi:hypothetical protein
MRVDQDAEGNWIVIDGDTVIRSPIFKTNEDAWRWVDRHDHNEWIEWRQRLHVLYGGWTHGVVSNQPSQTTTPRMKL